SLGAGAGLSRSGVAASSGALLLAPSLELGADAFRLSAGGSLARFPSGAASAEWQGSAAWRAPAWRGLRAEGRLDARGLALPSDPGLARAAGVARLRLGGDSAAALWVEGGAGRILRGSGPRGLGVLGAGGQVRIGGASVRLSVQGASVEGLAALFRDSVYVLNDTLARVSVQERAGEPGRRYADAELAAAWGRGRLALDAAVGTRLAVRGVARETWSRVGGAVRIDRRATLVASFGTLPGAPEFGTGRAPFGVVALRFNAAPRPPLPAPAALPLDAEAGAFEVRPAAAGARVLSVRVAARERVEIRGDFSDWEPLPLSRAPGDRWELSLPLRPGLYRADLRVDGGDWSVPPGLAREPDEFGGATGLLVVP
ncbi:MAG: glycogen-binding domain-containing protein, partial [Gemmatimonadota bacterium]